MRACAFGGRSSAAGRRDPGSLLAGAERLITEHDVEKQKFADLSLGK
jgi:hypothetical protein